MQAPNSVASQLPGSARRRAAALGAQLPPKRGAMRKLQTDAAVGERSGHGWPRWSYVARENATPHQRGVVPPSGMMAKKRSRPVSRVLCALRRDSHSSRPDVAIGLKQPTRERCGPHHRSPIRSCSRWGLPCRSVARLAVRSCRTVSPLPDPRAGPSAVYSLLHFPSARAAQALPGTLPCGARTFLGIHENDATVRPTPSASIEAGARGEYDGFSLAIRPSPLMAHTVPCAVPR